MHSPCRKCTTKRHIGCHGTCNDYIKWCEEVNKNKPVGYHNSFVTGKRRCNYEL